MHQQILSYIAGVPLDRLLGMSDSDIFDGKGLGDTGGVDPAQYFNKDMKPLVGFVRANRILDTFRQGRLSMIDSTRRNYQAGGDRVGTQTGRIYSIVRDNSKPVIEALSAAGYSLISNTVPGIPKSKSLEVLLTKIATNCSDFLFDQYVTGNELNVAALKDRLLNAMYSGAPDMIDALVADISGGASGAEVAVFTVMGDVAKVMIGVVDELREKTAIGGAMKLEAPTPTAPKVELSVTAEFDDAMFKQTLNVLSARARKEPSVKRLTDLLGAKPEDLIESLATEVYKVLRRRPDAQPNLFMAVQSASKKYFSKGSNQYGVGLQLFKEGVLDSVTNNVINYLQGEGLKMLSNLIGVSLASTAVDLAKRCWTWFSKSGDRELKRLQQVEKQKKLKPTEYQAAMQKALLLNPDIPRLPPETSVCNETGMLLWFTQSESVVAKAFDVYKESLSGTFLTALRGKGPPPKILEQVRDSFIYSYDTGAGQSYKEALTMDSKIIESKSGQKTFVARRTLASYHGMKAGLELIKAPPIEQFELLFLMSHVEGATALDEKVPDFIMDRIKTLGSGLQAKAFTEPE